MSEPTRRSWATIDLAALCNNLARARALAGASAVYPVIKANAYGHGMEQAARALVQCDPKPGGLAIATMAEAVELRRMELGLPILLLNGFVNDDELQLLLEGGIEPVLHAAYQVEMLEKRLATAGLQRPLRVWLKHNSGMNRLGMAAPQCQEAHARLRQLAGVEIVLMSHLGYADDMDDPASREYTENQLAAFNALHGELEEPGQPPLARSLAASAGILTLPDTHFQYVRPGVMLYGSSPLARRSGDALGLEPVMTLSSRLISINQVATGGAIGYNATYRCEQDTLVGVVSIGYGDGYPRSAANGTPVLVKTASGLHRTRLIGRVSMDMITIDLSAIPDAGINDEVVLWGRGLCADEVASHAGTIAYELFCKVTRRVRFDYV